MASVSKKWSTRFSIYLTLCIATALGMRTHTFTHNYFNHAEYVKDESSLTSPGQVFGACDENHIPMNADREFNMQCTFIMETTKPIEEEGHVRVCNFSLNTNIPEYNESYYFVDDITAITENKAMLGLHGMHSFMLMLLDFVDCKVVHRLQNHRPMKACAVTKNNVDVITTNGRDFEQRLRVILDLDSKTKNEQFKHWYKTTARSDRIKAVVYSPDKHRIIVDIHESSARIYALSENGSYEMLKEYPIGNELYVHLEHQRVVSSTTHDLLTVCSKLKNTSTCSQFDPNGKLKFETKIPLEKARRLAVRNLPRGGFLLLMAKCRVTGMLECYYSEPSFIVKKYDAAGQLVGTLKIDNPSEREVFLTKIHVFESEKKEICLSDTNEEKRSDDLKLNIICLTNDDFIGNVTWSTN